MCGFVQTLENLHLALLTFLSDSSILINLHVTCLQAIRKAKKVFFIAKEIMSSESVFVDVLKLLNVVSVPNIQFQELPRFSNLVSSLVVSDPGGLHHTYSSRDWGLFI